MLNEIYYFIRWNRHGSVRVAVGTVEVSGRKRMCKHKVYDKAGKKLKKIVVITLFFMVTLVQIWMNGVHAS